MKSIKDIWKGEVSLSLIFWGYGLLSILLLQVGIMVVARGSINTDPYILGRAIVLIGYLVFVGYYGLVVVGIWRSSDKYIAKHRKASKTGKSRKIVWVYLARIIIFLLFPDPNRIFDSVDQGRQDFIGKISQQVNQYLPRAGEDGVMEKTTVSDSTLIYTSTVRVYENDDISEIKNNIQGHMEGKEFTDQLCQDSASTRIFERNGKVQFRYILQTTDQVVSRTYDISTCKH